MQFLTYVQILQSFTVFSPHLNESRHVSRVDSSCHGWLETWLVHIFSSTSLVLYFHEWISHVTCDLWRNSSICWDSAVVYSFFMILRVFVFGCVLCALSTESRHMWHVNDSSICWHSPVCYIFCMISRAFVFGCVCGVLWDTGWRRPTGCLIS